MTVPRESNQTKRWNQADEYHKRGMFYFDRENFPDAIRYFDKALEALLREDPRYLRAKYYKGISLENLGDRDNENNEKYSEALKCFEEILSDDSIRDQPPYPYVLSSKGRTLGKLRSYEKAIDDFERALRAFCTLPATAQVDITDDVVNTLRDKGITDDVVNTLRDKGYAHAMLDQRNYAYDSLKKAIKLDPKFALSYNTKGYIENIFGSYEDAINSFAEAIKLDPNFGLAWCNQGYAYCSLADNPKNKSSKESEDNYKKAIDCFDKAISIDPDRVPYSPYEWNYKGYALLFGFKKYREAVNNFDKAIELDPNFELAWINKGFALYSEGYLLESSKKYDESIKCFDNAINAYKCRMKAQKELGDLAKNIDNLLEGKGGLLECLEKIDNPAINSEFQRILINLAYALAGKGVSLDSLGDKEESYSEAIKCFDKVIKILKALEGLGMLEGMAANLAVVYYHKGYTCAKRQEYKPAVECFEEAIRYYDKGQAAEPKDRAKLPPHTDKANILRNEAFAYASLGEQDQAAKLYQDAINEDKKFYLAWNSKGYHILYFLILRKTKKDKLTEDSYNEAINCFKTAIDLAKQQGNEFAYGWYNKGVALYCLGEYKEENEEKKEMGSSIDCDSKYVEAKECFDMATKLNDKYADAWYFRGITLFRLKHYDQATRSFDEAIQRNHKHTYAWNSKGVALCHLGRYGDATDCFGKAIEIYKAREHKQDDAADLALTWIYKGQAFVALKEYNEAIKSFGEAIHIDNIDKLDSDLSDQAYLYRGESKYELGKYPDALADFRKVEVSGNNGRKYNNIGLCRYQLGNNEQAKDDFCKSKSEDPKLAAAYYNLAVMYNIENNPDQAKRMLETCRNIDRNFSKAEVAIKKLGETGSPHKIEWYNWWFTRERGKKVLGLLLIVSVLIPFLIIALVVDYFVTHLGLHTTMHTGLTSIIKNNATAIITGLTVLIGISIGVLLLPSLTRIKVGVIEFNVASTDPDTKNIELKPIQDPTQLDLRKFPIDFQMQSFTRPLNFQMLGLKMPISAGFYRMGI